MDFRTAGRRTWTRTKDLARNRYLWAGLFVLLLLVGGLYLLFNQVLMPTFTRHEVTVTVPDVTRRSFEEAQQLLQEHDLQVQKAQQRYNPALPRGVVVEQEPGAEALVKPGRRVYLTVNTGRETMVQIPSVVDVSLREARNRLMAVGLEVEDVRVDSIPSLYANVVTRQDPAAGDSLREGGAVVLWYSTGLGEEYVDVPDVTGMTVAEAQDALLDRKLRSMVINPDADEEEEEEEEEGDDEVSRQEVVRQSRAPGTRVRTGFEVRLYLEADEQ